MKTYNDYQISISKNSLNTAFKKNATTKNGIKFNHRVLFQYCQEQFANCVINGKFAKAQEPSCGWGGENYYQSTEEVNGNLILSPDMKEFMSINQSLPYFNLNHYEFKN